MIPELLPRLYIPSFQSIELAVWVIVGLLAVHVVVLLVKN